MNSDKNTPDQGDFDLSQPEEIRPWAVRNGFPGWLMGLGWSVGSFVSFQVLASIIVIILLLVLRRIDVSDFSSEALYQNLDLLFVSNSIGQIIFLGFCTWVVARLSTLPSTRTAFLRLSPPPNVRRNILFAILIVIAAQPLIMVFSWLNLQVPFGDAYLDFELAQMKMIENYLRSDHVVLFTLFHVAMVPALCEEVLFRGYVLRNFEKSMTPLAAILLSGIVFGIFHVRLTQLIPLAIIGMLLAWMTWRSGSIWPAIAAHFANNATAVLFATYFPEIAFNEAMQGNLPPWYFIIWSIILTGVLLYFINAINTSKTAEAYVWKDPGQ